MKTFASTTADSSRHQSQALWTWIKRRRLLVGSAVVAVLGLALGWNWLAAAGVLPILFATLPCALMMGMCMKGMGSNKSGSSCSQDKQNEASTASDSTAPPVSLPAGSSQRRIEEKDHA
jgi:hypothetical protein